MITALDHIALVVKNLDAALDGLTRLLGREADWRGSGGGTRHVWYQLGNTALDVIQPGEGNPMFAGAGGLWALAFATDDMEGDRKRLSRLSVASMDPMPVRTKTEDGQTRTWPTAIVTDGANGVTTFLVGETPAWPASPAVGDEAGAVSGLDHVVVSTRNPDRAAAFYGARLGLPFKLDRSNPDWGTRLMFFQCGDLIVEVAQQLKQEPGDDPDSLWGLSWRVPDIDAAHARIGQSFAVSDIRDGRKPGTRVFTVKDAPEGVPTLILGRTG